MLSYFHVALYGVNGFFARKHKETSRSARPCPIAKQLHSRW